MRLQELVDASNGVAEANGRLDKTSRLADLLKRREPEEIPAAVAFLSGSPLQGRIGIGWSLIAQARTTIAAEQSWSSRSRSTIFRKALSTHPGL
jgi:DNA ligase-1